MSALGVGSMLGALIVASSSSRGPNRVRLFVVPFITSSLFMIMAFNRSYAFSALLIGLMGFANIFFTTTANSLMQINSDNEFRGRVMSVYSLVFAGSTPIGNMFVGSIADKAGGGSAFFWAGVVTFFLVAATIIAHKIRKRSVRVKPEQHPD
jgi:predicted MFS family arabinose efflux permease